MFNLFVVLIICCPYYLLSLFSFWQPIAGAELFETFECTTHQSATQREPLFEEEDDKNMMNNRMIQLRFLPRGQAEQPTSELANRRTGAE